MVPFEVLVQRLNALQVEMPGIDVSEPWQTLLNSEGRNWDVFVLRMETGADTRLIDALNRVEDLKRELPLVDWGNRRPATRTRLRWMARVHAWAAARRS